MKYVDLNCDLGESFGNWKCGMDEEVLPCISSANVACGFHASDPLVMRETVKRAAANGVSIGAHPGYPDLVGFGRRKMDVKPEELKSMVIYQIGALRAFCEAAHVPLAHVKPHGAMYNTAGKDMKLATAIVEGIYEVDPNLILLGLDGSLLIEAAKKTGLAYAREVFADRAYNDDGSLVPRGLPGAVIEDTAVALSRVISMVKLGCVKSINGKHVEVHPDSICLHGDGRKAVDFSREIHEELLRENVTIAPLKEVIKWTQ